MLSRYSELGVSRVSGAGHAVNTAPGPDPAGGLLSGPGAGRTTESRTVPGGTTLPPPELRASPACRLSQLWPLEHESGPEGRPGTARGCRGNGLLWEM